MKEEIVEPQEAEPIEQIVEQAEAEAPAQDVVAEESSTQTMIPLSVAQKLREKNRERELEIQFLRQQNAELLSRAPQAPKEDDNSRYESATKEDLSHVQNEAVRIVEERLWIRQNPEKYERVNQELETFLKTRPHLATAIKEAPNRYEEAFTLLDALSPKPKQEAPRSAPPPKKVAPNAPGGVPKSTAMVQTIDVMKMSDKEYLEWRNSKCRR